jgi:hypothetical protein
MAARCSASTSIVRFCACKRACRYAHRSFDDFFIVIILLIQMQAPYGAAG